MIAQRQLSNTEVYLRSLQLDASTWKFKVKSIVRSLPFNTFDFPIKSMETKYKGKFFKIKNRNAMVQG